MYEALVNFPLRKVQPKLRLSLKQWDEYLLSDYHERKIAYAPLMSVEGSKVFELNAISDTFKKVEAWISESLCGKGMWITSPRCSIA